MAQIPPFPPQASPDSVEAAENALDLRERDLDALDGLLGPVVEPLSDLLPFGPAVTRELLLTAIVVVVVAALRRVALAVVRRRAPEDSRRLYQWKKTSSYIAGVVLTLALFQIWVGETANIGTFLGLLTAGIAIALRDPLVDLAGWGFVLWRRPFVTGDRITINGLTGDVVDQRVFQFTLLEVGTKTGAGQSTGRIVHVPNGWVFTNSVTNHTGTFAYVWNEVAVVVTFESDWRGAKRLLLEVAHECADHLSDDAERTLRAAAREYFIFYSKLTPTVYTSVVGEGVQLTMRYLVAPRRVRGSEQDVWEAILDRFEALDTIDLAYPTTRMYRNDLEGKSGAGGPPRTEA
ncbi:mechanosensitive ion channel family protein [Rubrivirga sp.]|uniref:mechanosensitive ion channel family protein n=1 Tax=Rubrivirga sp. TaxID=1885344 RepID=UPI003C736B7E